MRRSTKRALLRIAGGMAFCVPAFFVCRAAGLSAWAAFFAAWALTAGVNLMRVVLNRADEDAQAELLDEMDDMLAASELGGRP